MRIYSKYIIFFAVIVTIISSTCKHKENERTNDKSLFNKKSLIKVNKYLVKKDAEIIRDFVERRNWNMDTTETGLWYMIYKKGNGKKAKTDKIATINYSIDLLDGSHCYSSDSLCPKKFRIGKGGVESGLEEGILLLREGDRAKFILPPYMAHGLLGDEKKIPPRAILLYDIELIQISDK